MQPSSAWRLYSRGRGNLALRQCCRGLQRSVLGRALQDQRRRAPGIAHVGVLVCIREDGRPQLQGCKHPMAAMERQEKVGHACTCRCMYSNHLFDTTTMSDGVLGMGTDIICSKTRWMTHIRTSRRARKGEAKVIWSLIISSSSGHQRSIWPHATVLVTSGIRSGINTSQLESRIL